MTEPTPSTPMSDERLQELKNYKWVGVAAPVMECVAEIERLRGELRESNQHVGEMQPLLGKLKSEVEELSASLQEMTAACQQAVDCCPMCAADEECQDDVCGELRRVLELSRLRGAK